MRKRKNNINIVLLLLAFALSLGFAATSDANGLNSPWEAPKETYFVKQKKSTSSKRSTKKRYETNPAKIPFLWGLKFYQRVISKMDGDKCGMYPTCSGYSVRAIKKHGAAIGLMMTADRLFHEGTEMERAPLIKKYGVIRYYDPVENNDFWFYDKNDPS